MSARVLAVVITVVALAVGLILGWLGSGLTTSVSEDAGTRIRRDCESIARELGYLPLPPKPPEDNTPFSAYVRWTWREDEALNFVDACIRQRADRP